MNGQFGQIGAMEILKPDIGRIKHGRDPLLSPPFYRKPAHFARGRSIFVYLYKKKEENQLESGQRERGGHSSPAVVRMRSTSATRRGQAASAARCWRRRAKPGASSMAWPHRVTNSSRSWAP
jgi:hypothetical protein